MVLLFGLFTYLKTTLVVRGRGRAVVPTQDIPVFKLYGETQHWPTPDLLHCESIPERSQLHNWLIKPHRHTDLVHILYIEQGSVEWELEGTLYQLYGATIIIVPEMTIHGFRFSSDVQGQIITLAKPLADHLHQTANTLDTLTNAKFYRFSDASQALPITSLITHISHEYQRPAFGRSLLLEALTQALVIELSRLISTRPTNHNDPLYQKGNHHFSRFQTLIEQHYREQPSLEAFAKKLEISSAHLNLVCRKLAGSSALQLLHERILLESKRQLTYTNMTIAQVADSLGFSEPAYFTRFFKRNTSLSPSVFRKRQAHEINEEIS